MKRSKSGEVHMGAQQQQQQQQNIFFVFPIQIKWKTVKMREQL